MQEYWINVYGSGRDKVYGFKHMSIEDADHLKLQWQGDPLIAYRIHVKMDGGYNKRKEVKYIQYSGRLNRNVFVLNWMG